jgi:hypothetical protein
LREYDDQSRARLDEICESSSTNRIEDERHAAAGAGLDERRVGARASNAVSASRATPSRAAGSSPWTIGRPRIGTVMKLAKQAERRGCVFVV